MSYLVLARKYRPKTFSEVVGQEHVTQTLANAFEKDRVHHAFLFCGPRGVGKTTLARILGKALNCEKGPTSDPCGECSACVTITDGSAVDYYEMDGASNRGIDSIRELTDAVRYQPAVLRKKVYVIDEVHMLTTEAFNALLKTLEEPPPHVSFVLATTEPHKIPNTILSRCQRYDFKLVPTPRLSAHLSQVFTAEQLTIEPSAISLIVRESGGSVRDALSLSDQIISYVGGATITEQAVAQVLGVADRSLTRTLVTALARGDAATALEAVDIAIARGIDEVQLARAIVRYLRDLAVIQAAPESENLVEGTAEERAELLSQVRAMDRGRAVQMFDRMVRACNDLGDTRQPRLVLDLALIEVAAIEPLVPLGDLIERLGALERYLSRRGDPRAGGGGGSPQSDAGGHGGRGPRGQNPRGPNPPPRRADHVDPEPVPVLAAQAEPPRPTASAAATAPEPEPAPKPAKSKPVQSKPAKSKPAESKPAQSKPAESKPAESKPVQSKPVQSKPVQAKPAEPKPAEPKPAEPPFVIEPPSQPSHASQGPTTAAPLPDDIWNEWENVLAALGNTGRVVLVAAMEHAKLLSWDDAGVVLGLTAESEMLVTDERIREMASFLTKHYARPVGLKARPLSPAELEDASATRSIEEVKRARAAALDQRKREEVYGHPSYKRCKERFGPFTRVEINTNVRR